MVTWKEIILIQFELIIVSELIRRVFDQYLISIRIDEWMKANAQRPVLEFNSGKTIPRIDLTGWNYFPNFRDPQRHFDSLDDVHRIPLGNGTTFPWQSFRFLLKQMYGHGSKQMKWAIRYTRQLLQMMSHHH